MAALSSAPLWRHQLLSLRRPPSSLLPPATPVLRTTHGRTQRRTFVAPPAAESAPAPLLPPTPGHAPLKDNTWPHSAAHLCDQRHQLLSLRRPACHLAAPGGRRHPAWVRRIAPRGCTHVVFVRRRMQQLLLVQQRQQRRHKVIAVGQHRGRNARTSGA
eukprot:364386-Chlamydomonas_euryale.AAC.2